MTPFFIEPNRADPMRAQMDRYGAVVREVAAAYDAVFVDTQAAFDGVLDQLHPMTLAWDRVHPTLTGHMVLARAFLDAVGYQWRESGGNLLPGHSLLGPPETDGEKGGPGRECSVIRL